MTQTIQSHSVDRLPAVGVRVSSWRKAVFEMDESHPEVLRMTNAAEGFLRRAINNDRSRGSWFVIAGRTGCGKTHVAKATLRQFAAWGCSAGAAGKWGNLRWDFVDWPSMLADRNFEDRLEELMDINFLCLDDIGSESDQFRGGENTGRLRRVLELFSKRWLLVTTNIPRDKWGDFYDVRVASRLEAAGKVSVFSAPDWRKKE